MVNRLIVKDLFGVKGNDFDLAFNPDLNILTGKNGVGKTTILKLIWLALSDKSNLVTGFDGTPSFTSLYLTVGEDWINIEKKVINQTSIDLKTSYSPTFPHVSTIFMPTFRRIEGRFPWNLTTWTKEIPSPDVNRKHQFVVNATTSDIVNLTAKRFAELHSAAQKVEDEASAFISKITQTQSGNAGKLSSEEIIRQIVEHQEKTSLQKKQILRPLTLFTETVEQFIKEKGIVLSNSFSLGDVNTAISSELLSSGEKQILSFIAYSLLNENSIIFIDEPELSLHPDWQRRLFPLLLELAATNQFFIATHSPFIYSKYPDKEIRLVEDRGGE